MAVCRIVYEIAAYDRPTSMTFVGEGKTFRGTDVISFSEDPAGTRVTYVADLGLKGLTALAMPFIRGKLDGMSDDAVGGLRRALDARA